MRFPLAFISALVAAICTITVFIFSGAGENAAVKLILSFLIPFLITLTFLRIFIFRPIQKIADRVRLISGGQGNTGKGNVLETLNDSILQLSGYKKEEIEKLKSLEHYRKEFIGNVSHELKTPIFNIQGYISTLLEGGLEDDRINKDYLQRAERSVDRMITIIEDLETITRLESGQLILDETRFDIHELIKEVAEQEELFASGKGITIKIDKNFDRPLYVRADKEKIRQVATNLIINSLKYGKEKGETVIRSEEESNSVIIHIEDNGLGIPEHHLPRLFERFYRVDKSRSREQGGSGLGLAIVKHILEAHHQNIWVESSEGVGSRFSFTLARAI